MLPPEIVFSTDAGRVELPLVPRILPMVPGIRLYLPADELPSARLQAGDFHALLQQPPYWAFCWGGGQALARWMLLHGERFAGHRVWDFGAGSGVAGIAALLAGAREAVAVDIDADALQACKANAVLNAVENLQVSTACSPVSGDIVLAADICYEEAGLSRVRDWAREGVVVYVAESRLSPQRLGVTGLQLLWQCEVRTFPDLEEAACFDQVAIYRVNA